MCCKFNADGSLLAVGQSDGIIKVCYNIQIQMYTTKVVKIIFQKSAIFFSLYILMEIFICFVFAEIFSINTLTNAKK
jgi:WD40 repeat protein